MALELSFKTAIDLVDSSVLLTSVENEPGYGFFEFSYSCSVNTYTIRGGSTVACAHGAVHLLEAMGFKFLAPPQQFWVKPAGPSLPKNLTQTKTQFWMPSSSYRAQYASAWDYALIAWRTIISDANRAWYDLVGWWHQPYPNGHRQQSVIAFHPTYFAANPQLLTNKGRSFNLAAMTNAEKDYVATLAASFLLNDTTAAASLALYGKYEYDAADGDPNSSDEYFAHAVLVCQKVRAGVPSVEGRLAKAGVPGAQLGVYAYAGHKAKPSFDVRPYIYVGVALNYSPKPTWVQRMTAHKDNSVAILTRDYLDFHQSTMGMPMNGRRMHREYPDDYDAYKAAGCIGMVGGDGNENFLINLVANRHLNMKLRTGTYTYTQARDDVVNGLLGGDTAAADLYDYIMDPYASFTRFSLYDVMDLVDALADGWFKTYWEQLCVLAYEYVTLPDKPLAPATGDAYDLALTAHIKHAVGVAQSQIFHAYGHIRRLCGAGNTPAGGPYGHLYFGQSSAPYYTSYSAPTHAEYLAAKAALAPTILRAADLDSTDLMVVHNLTPRCAPTPKASRISTLSRTTIAFVGPGNVTLSGTVFVEDPNNPGEFIEEPFVGDPVYYGPGIHYLREDGNLTYTCDAGLMFLATYPLVRIVQGVGGGDLWVYVPGRCAGNARAEAKSRFQFQDQNGVVQVTPSTALNNASMNNLGPGQIKLDGLQTADNGMVTNMNKWGSMDPTKQLMPAVVAAEDFPALSYGTPG